MPRRVSIVPDLIMRALFMRGKFTAADATAAGQTLAAYALGLLPFVLIRSVAATFLARGDTATPMKASLTAVGVNVALKALFTISPHSRRSASRSRPRSARWLNLVLVVYFAARQGHLAFDPPCGTQSEGSPRPVSCSRRRSGCCKLRSLGCLQVGRPGATRARWERSP